MIQELLIIEVGLKVFLLQTNIRLQFWLYLPQKKHFDQTDREGRDRYESGKKIADPAARQSSGSP
jgi:hypothetical protein